jgi:hypothetical protein
MGKIMRSHLKYPLFVSKKVCRHIVDKRVTDADTLVSPHWLSVIGGMIANHRDNCV